MPRSSINVAVSWEPVADTALRARAGELAEELGYALVAADSAEGGHDGLFEMLLVVTGGRLEVRVLKGEEGLRGGRAVWVDLLRVDATTGQGRSLRQPLARAVGLRKGDAWRARVVDATAGFGEDAWLLASLGCEVTAVERSPVVAALLEDGLKRAGQVQPEAASLMRVVCTESAELLGSLSGDARPEVVYLDPMFPSARGSALERKPMRVLRMLVGGDADAGGLLGAGMAAATRRVVVKRPMRAEPLGGIEPLATHRGQAVRYDVYGGS